MHFRSILPLNSYWASMNVNGSIVIECKSSRLLFHRNFNSLVYILPFEADKVCRAPLSQCSLTMSTAKTTTTSQVIIPCAILRTCLLKHVDRSLFMKTLSFTSPIICLSWEILSHKHQASTRIHISDTRFQCSTKLDHAPNYTPRTALTTAKFPILGPVANVGFLPQELCLH